MIVLEVKNDTLMKRFLSILFFLYSCLIFSQDISQKSEIKLKAIATKNSIVLRWGVTDPIAWKFSNQYGFILERKTITRNNKVLITPEIKVLTPKPLKPKPLEQWEAFTETNDNAAIVAQAIYGESFNVGINNGGSEVVRAINLAQELEQRFSLSLYAADQDFKVAMYAGLAYEDTDVKEGERYLYTVKSVVPDEKYKIGSGNSYLGLADYLPLPAPIELIGIFKDKVAMLSWNAELQKNWYSSYIVERSEDNGKTFQVITNPPLVYIRSKENYRNTMGAITFQDKLKENNKIIQYRVRGVSFYGKKGPYSKIISGKGTASLQYTPYITKAILDEKEKNVLITWEFKKEGLEGVKAFKIVRANSAKGNYKDVLTNISKSKNSTLVSLTNAPVNYYKVVAVGIDGTKKESFPKMIQLEDITPPEIPTMLSGTIDSLGVVRLQWKQNIETDFLGYRVFRASVKNQEFSQITFTSIPRSQIIDTITLKTLNDKVYYKVRAFDTHLNPSEFSEVLELKRPDVVPPSQPVFSSFKVKNGKVHLSWVSSTSRDAVSTLLYRKVKGKKIPWELLAEFPIEKQIYIDDSVAPLKDYLYTLLAVDDAGLESEPIVPLSVAIPDQLPKPNITYFKASVDRPARSIKLKWKYKQEDVVEFRLYKAENADALTLYKIFDKDKRDFIDKELKVNAVYQYLLQATYKSGAKSPIKTIKLKY